MEFAWQQVSQVSRTLLSILATLNNAVVLMFSACFLISKSSSPCTSPLVTVPRVPITIGVTVTLMFHTLSNSLASSRYLSFFWFSFSFTLWSDGTAKSTILQVLLFLLIITMSGRLVKIRGFICISKSQRSLWISFSRTDSELCIYHLFVWLNLDFLHNSQWITLPTQLCQVFYSFWANLLCSLIMCLIVSSLALHNQHLLSCCVLSILALIWLVLMALFCAAIRKDSVSLLRFSFLSHVHIFLCEMPLVSPLKRP